MTDLDSLAERVATNGRTLRRAAGRGTIFCQRPSERRIEVSARERQYVRRHWPLLRSLIEVLRTQPNVRLAVLYGSVARGEGESTSDLDVLVRLRDDSYVTRAQIVDPLEAASGRRAHLVSVEQAKESPLLLTDVLRDGRVLVDRDRDWVALRRQEASIRRRARQQDARLEREAWSVKSLGRWPQ